MPDLANEARSTALTGWALGAMLGYKKAQDVVDLLDYEGLLAHKKIGRILWAGIEARAYGIKPDDIDPFVLKMLPEIEAPAKGQLKTISVANDRYILQCTTCGATFTSKGATLPCCLHCTQE